MHLLYITKYYLKFIRLCNINTAFIFLFLFKHLLK